MRSYNRTKDLFKNKFDGIFLLSSICKLKINIILRQDQYIIIIVK